MQNVETYWQNHGSIAVYTQLRGLFVEEVLEQAFLWEIFPTDEYTKNEMIVCFPFRKKA